MAQAETGPEMFAVVGLGNPGRKYQKTRHNAGFRVVEELARICGAPVVESWQEKFNCRFVKCSTSQQKLLLVEPQKFMNLSGEAAVPLLRWFQIQPEKLIVVHDELDVAVGQLRLKRGGGSGGHRGVADLVRHFGTEDFHRVRVGVGHPRDVDSPLDVSDWVLTEPAAAQQALLISAEKNAVDAVLELMSSGLERAQLKFHSLQG